MNVSASAPSAASLACIAGGLAAGLFLLPRLAAVVPLLALPLSIAGLFSALPLLVVRTSGGFVHAGLALATTAVVLAVADSMATSFAYAVLFGFWALLAGEVLARRRSVVAGGAAGFAALAALAVLAGAADGTTSIENTLRSPQVQAAFDQWATQVPLDPAEAKATIERVRNGIVALYPSLSVISAATIVALNTVALGRFIQLAPNRGFPADELLTFRWPFALVVTFVASGALLLIPDLQRVAWNGLVVTLFLFLLQGLSVLCFTLVKIFPSRFMRALLVMAALLGPWAILLSLLGLFDQWFDFRGRFATEAQPPGPTLQ